MKFEKKEKLNPRYIRLLEILWIIGDVAYDLALPPDLSSIHQVSHLSMLQCYNADKSHVICLGNSEVRKEVALC